MKLGPSLLRFEGRVFVLGEEVYWYELGLGWGYPVGSFNTYYEDYSHLYNCQ
jgi:hypothetical protein